MMPLKLFGIARCGFGHFFVRQSFTLAALFELRSRLGAFNALSCNRYRNLCSFLGSSFLEASVCRFRRISIAKPDPRKYYLARNRAFLIQFVASRCRSHRTDSSNRARAFTASSTNSIAFVSVAIADSKTKGHFVFCFTPPYVVFCLSEIHSVITSFPEKQKCREQSHRRLQPLRRQRRRSPRRDGR